jgi:hypothetical protein
MRLRRLGLPEQGYAFFGLVTPTLSSSIQNDLGTLRVFFNFLLSADPDLGAVWPR